MSEKRPIGESVARPPPLKKRILMQHQQEQQQQQQQQQQQPANQPIVSSSETTMTTIDPSHCSKSELLERMHNVKNDLEKETLQFEKINKQIESKEGLSSLIKIHLTLLWEQLIIIVKAYVNPTRSLDMNYSDNQLLLQEIQDLSEMIYNYIISYDYDSESSKVQEIYPHLQQTIRELEHVEKTKSDHMNHLVSTIQQTQSRCEEQSERFIDHIDTISLIEKKHDRSNSNIVKEIMGIKSSVSRGNSPESTAARETSPINYNVDYENMLNNRTNELRELKKENEALKWKLDELYSRFETMTPDYLRSRSDYIFELQSSFEFFKSSISHYEQKQADLVKLEADMRNERKQLIDQHRQEMTSRKTILATEQTRIQDNLNRIRIQSDELEKKLGIFIAKEDERKATIKDLYHAVNEHKNRMIELEDVIQKKRQLDTVPSDIMEKCERVQRLKDQIKQAHGMIQANDGDDKSILTQKGELADQFKLLDELVRERERLMLLIDFFEKTEVQLYKQMDCDGHVYEEKLPQIKNQIQVKEQQKLKLQNEIIKYKTTNTKLMEKNKELEQLQVDKKGEMQLHEKTITQLKEKSEAIEAKIIEKESRLAKINKDLDNYRMEIEDMSQECIELQSNLNRDDTKLIELQDMSNDKAKLLEKETDMTNQVQEKHDKLDKKWNMIQHGENPASQELQNEVEELKSQFKCSTCRTRTRKVILLTCYHTFCKECIKTRLDTRQRRCPSCAISFSASDVQTFYLYNTN